ncbi:hypothetical protein BKA56DRAFT_675173 [Ilyonectria sp. MPI-CAGE-AT-0026]|nr:hypothetical protein BKA56DRAFT_675173 [Ilyonectria sp. MPI-CAGE-AT-0026]
MLGEIPGSWPDDFSSDLLRRLQDVFDQNTGDVQRQPTRHGTTSLENQTQLAPTDDHRMSTTTTSSKTSTSAAWPWRVIRLAMYLLGWLFTSWPCLLVLFGISVLFVFQLSAGASVPQAWLNATSLFFKSLSWVFMATLKFAFGVSTRLDTAVPPTTVSATTVSAAFGLPQEPPKLMMIANTVALSIGNIVAFHPNAARLAKPPDSNLVGPVRDLELFMQESLFEAVEDDHFTLKALLREQRSMSASAPVSWAMRLRGRTHHTAAVVRLERLASTFRTIQGKREDLWSLLSAGRYKADEVYAPLNKTVCTWSINLDRLVGNEEIGDLRGSSEELGTAYRHGYTMCKTVNRAWQELLEMEGVLREKDIPWLQDITRGINWWVSKFGNPITMEVALNADELLQHLVDEYLGNLQSWYYERPRAERS